MTNGSKMALLAAVCAVAAAIGYLVSAEFTMTGDGPTDRVSVAIGNAGHWDTLIVQQGIDAGLFAEENISVDITWSKGGAETIQAVTTGSVDMGFGTGILGVLGAYQQGANVRIVGAEMTGSDLFWYALRSSDLADLSNASGKRIGYSRHGSSTHLVLLALLEQSGTTAEIVSAGGIPDSRIQVMTGQLDVGWSVPPFNLDLVRQGEANIVARGSEVVGIEDQTVRVNIANRRFLNDQHGLATRFMRAYSKTIEWMYNNLEEATARFAEFNGLDGSIAGDAVGYYSEQALQPFPVKGIKKSMREALEYDVLQEELSDDQIEELINYVYVEE